MSNPATYIKLRNGSWAIQVDHEVAIGKKTMAKKQNGGAFAETIKKPISTDGGFWIYSIEPRKGSLQGLSVSDREDFFGDYSRSR